LTSTSLPDLVPEAFEDWQTDEDDVWDFYNSLREVKEKVESASVRLIVGWNSYLNAAIVTGYVIGINEVWCAKLESSADGRDVSMRMNRDNPIFLITPTYEDVDLAELLDGWLEPTDLGERGQISASNEQESSKLSVLPGLFSSVRDAGLERPGAGLRSWLSGFRGALPRLDQLLSIPAPGVQGSKNVYLAREFTAFLSWLIIGPAMLLREQLRQVRYLGPLRRVPARDFDVSLSQNDAAWADGMAAWEILLTGSQTMVERCSGWMERPDRLKTGYALKRTRVQEYDLASAVPLPTGRPKNRLCLVDQRGLPHQPLDVGVGISQVLPVVVAAQDEYASIVTVEQPELHVHPAVQVGLGDLFIEGAIERGLSFLLETHSEHLILRLLRRIREAAESGDTTQINPDLLGVYYLSNDNGNISATRLPVNVDGDFDIPWPRGFFEERGAELF